MVRMHLFSPIHGIAERISAALGAATRIHRDMRGAAAVELGVILPFIATAFIVMVDLGEAIDAKYDIERKMRLAIEGVQRYGDDTTKVLAFANADGNAAFSGQNNIPQNTASLTITPYYICRASDGTTTKFTDALNVTCPDYETWYEISSSGSATGVFGKTYNLSTQADLLAD